MDDNNHLNKIACAHGHAHSLPVMGLHISKVDTIYLLKSAVFLLFGGLTPHIALEMARGD